MSVLSDGQIAVLKIMKRGSTPKTTNRITEMVNKNRHKPMSMPSVRDKLVRLEHRGLVKKSETFDKKLRRWINTWEITDAGRTNV